ncbi:cytochrome C oxidase assembly protein [Actibacterium mucosum KCTC 23349]|uniref:Cytochrome C oxidase assembly protein n=1 Tax=Actibacterium mucosum KCTC 23349 TaxID=1454373 RepID=A0A037ZMI5_9RHOB|nr:hypothetical protein [Actibacterium mucosum]KAJ56016.1 cytochrome C oxidase assembly protein [Actibacterium mucosum KCTC 23349]
MSFRDDHELHKRRFGRNMALFAVLAGFVVLIFGMTIVRVGEIGPGNESAQEASE